MDESGIRLTRSLAINIYENKPVARMIGALICISGDYIGGIFRINSDKKIYFGRNYKEVDFYFRDETISGNHCWIEYQGENERYVLYDTSLNGVFVNGRERIPKNVETILKKGDEIRLASTGNIFKMG